MLLRRHIFGFIMATALLALPAMQAGAVDLENTIYLELKDGRVTIEMRPDLAPKHVARIKELVRQKFYDGTVFHRVIEDFMAQTGDPTGTGTGGSGQHIDAEFSSEKHLRGALSMARFDPGTADGDFFIIVGHLPGFDAGRAAPDDPGFAVFGRVVDGMEVVRAILAAPKSATEGEGFMRGQMLEPRVRIVSARRIEAAAP